MVTRIDRERIGTFLRFLWKRFLDDECFQTAGALAYTTIFALVPLTAAVFGVLSAFPVFAVWTDSLTDFIFRNFVPAAGSTVRDYLLTFAGNATRMTTVGTIVLLGSALLMMSAIEERLNRIWRVERRRPGVARFLLYWTALTLVPILVVGGVALSSYLFALPVLHGAVLRTGALDFFLRVLPFLTTLVGLFLLYILVPNRPVARRHAFTGALLGACLFELAKWGFGLYVSTVPSYQQLYGALAVVPIFLVWVYLSWVIVLLGASLAASLNAFDYRPASARLPAGLEFIGMLHILQRFVAAQRAGRGLHEEEIRTAFLSVDQQQRCLADLVRAGFVEQADGVGWILLRSLDSASLAELYRAGGYRLPLDEALIAPWLDGLSRPLRELLTGLAGTVRGQLETTLDTLFPLDSDRREGRP